MPSTELDFPVKFSGEVQQVKLVEAGGVLASQVSAPWNSGAVVTSQHSFCRNKEWNFSTNQTGPGCSFCRTLECLTEKRFFLSCVFLSPSCNKEPRDSCPLWVVRRRDSPSLLCWYEVEIVKHGIVLDVKQSCSQHQVKGISCLKCVVKPRFFTGLQT